MYCCFREKNGKQILKKLVFRPNTKLSTALSFPFAVWDRVDWLQAPSDATRARLPPCDGLFLARCYLGRPGRPSEHDPC